MSLSAAERETTIVWTDEDDTVRVSTSQRKVVTQLLKNPAFVTEEDYEFEGTRCLVGTLPLGSITIRKAAKGTIKRNGTTKRNPRANAAKCGAPTASGKPCGSIASKATGRCSKHS